MKSFKFYLIIDSIMILVGAALCAIFVSLSNTYVPFELAALCGFTGATLVALGTSMLWEMRKSTAEK
ncbi:hypothetical protein [Marinoscillum sp. MHG1-6]|uniref:hypothetical protein n=1 Tax=Marinoscillum sp. MHG1-6 TaxID=2959627 RepID=UPI00215827AA|nr:hypothetical protein [Marinoscillum sp. MHG1-6]